MDGEAGARAAGRDRPAPGWMGGLFRRFPDAAMEARYRRSERTSRAGSIRTLANIGLACMVALIVMNPIFMSPGAVARYNLFAVPLVISFVLFSQTTKSDLYARRPLVDVVAFTVFVGLVFGIVTVLASEFERLHWSFFALVTVNSMTMAAFASFAFLAAFGYFLVWTVVLLAAAAAVLFGLDLPSATASYSFITVLILAALALFCNWAIDARSREVFSLAERLRAERAKSESLLYNVLPQQVAERLREGGYVADAFSDATVVFVDIVSFSRLARTLSPGHLVDMLNAFFGAADECAHEFGVEKVKTIGDAYLAISGAMTQSPDAAGAAVRFGKALITRTAALAEQLGLELKVRVGVHTGPVIGGVIGSTRMSYDYWGDTMVVASRLQGAAQPNALCVSDATYFRTKEAERYDPPRAVVLKGIGEAAVHDLRVDTAAPAAGPAAVARP